MLLLKSVRVPIIQQFFKADKYSYKCLLGKEAKLKKDEMISQEETGTVRTDSSLEFGVLSCKTVP